MSIFRWLGVVGAASVAASLSAQAVPDTSRRPPVTPQDSAAARARDSLARDSLGQRPAITPQPDQARGVDAELRAALYDLATDQPMTALGRLDWLARGPAGLGRDSAQTIATRREDLLFLLAQSYLRVGMGAEFRSAAARLTQAGATRYARVIRLELMLDAYRRGDYARAAALAGQAGAEGTAGDLGLTSLIAGLSAYQTKNSAAARTSFATTQQAGGPYAPFARYMDALTIVQADTAQRAAALEALRALIGSASGEFADQVRVTAAEIAYEGGQYDDAVSLASGVSSGGGLAPLALLTRGWAQLRANRGNDAAAAFSQFATQYPELPERDEARLLAAQVVLQGGQTEEAGRQFDAIADSVRREMNAMQGRTAAMSDAARALVTARAAGLLFIGHPAAGKALALPDATGSDLGVLAAVFGDSASARVAVVPQAPDVVSFLDVHARLDTVGAALGADFPKRVFYVPASASAPTNYMDRADALRSADALAALARMRLQEQLDAQALRLATLQRLQQVIEEERSRLVTAEQQLAASRDSLARVSVSIDEVGARIRNLVRAQAVEARDLATENLRKIDSLRASLGASVGTTEGTILDVERSTGEIYQRLATFVDQQADSALARHPVVALRDSLRRRVDRIVALIGEVRSVLDETGQIVAAELGALQGGETEKVRAARAALATAEATRSRAEGELITVIDAELRARAAQMVATLRKDSEAAEFGSASAAFFLAVDAGRRTADGGGTRGESGGTAAGPVVGAQTAPAGGQSSSPR